MESRGILLLDLAYGPGPPLGLDHSLTRNTGGRAAAGLGAYGEASLLLFLGKHLLNPFKDFASDGSNTCLSELGEYAP